MKYFLTLLIATACLTAACSDDVVGVDNGCTEDQILNPITNFCQPKNTQTPSPTDTSLPGDQDTGQPQDTSSGGDQDTSTNPPQDTSLPGDQDTSTNPPQDTNPPEDTSPPENCGPGAIEGRACAPNGDILASATVTLTGVDCDGNPFTRTESTDIDGNFDFLEVPAGEHTLTVTSGSFSNDRAIFVNTGRVTDIRSNSEKICLNAASAKIAVIKGSYDDMQSVLTSLDLAYDIKGDDDNSPAISYPPFVDIPGGRFNDSLEFLTNPAAMAAYDILFINCGELWNMLSTNDRTAIVDNLRTYVASGKSLYTSDRAHPFIQQAFPNMADFYGADPNHAEAMRGYAPQDIAAQVVSPEMQTLLGRDTATIEFPHRPPSIVNNHWTVVAAPGSEGIVHLQGDAKIFSGDANSQPTATPVPDAPLMLTYKDPSGGTVIFTSFHNKAQATYNDDMKKIMRFMIFQL